MRVFVGLLVAGCVLGGLYTHTRAQPVPSHILERLDTSKRLLQPGDQLEINIFTLPEMEKKYQIRADGTFYHPFAGDVPAAGKTLQQLEETLRLRFKKELRKPAFRVGVTALAESEAAVLGEVRQQGKFKFAPGTSVMDLLAQAGGLGDKADRDGAVILRGGKQIALDMGPSGQSELARMMVQAGDILYVNRGKRVGVSGEVQDKGVYAVSSKSRNSVEDAVKAAGGAKETAALGRVQIIRPSLAKPIEVDLLNPQTASKIVLEDGDMVLVPARRAILLGAVSKPGNLPLVGSETLVDVLGQAGLAQAELEAVVVVRAADVLAGNDKKEVYNLQSSFAQGQAMVNVPIHDGDLVFVPSKEQFQGGLLGNGFQLMNILFMARSLLAI
ncbi:SLBB domain-containing protein [bacterium]|nr:SLBB domain-containing protein [bacterium]